MNFTKLSDYELIKALKHWQSLATYRIKVYGDNRNTDIADTAWDNYKGASNRVDMIYKELDRRRIAEAK